jgi:hypothetical protein
MAYYTGPSSTSIKSNSVKKNNIGKTNTNPGYGTQSAYDQLQAGRNNTMDNTRSSGVTYGGNPSGNSSSSSSSSGSRQNEGTGYSSSSGRTSDAYEEPTQTYTGDFTFLADDYYDNLKKLAAEAYDRSMGLVNDYYNTAKNSLQKNYDESVTTLGNTNAMNTKAITADAEEAMRQAYINNMLSRKSLQQAMVAQGLNGGATETTRANMENNYGEARNAIDTTKNKNLAELLNQYQNNLASLRQQLNTGLSDLENRRLDYSYNINSDIQDRLANYAEKLYDNVTNPQKLLSLAESSWGAMQDYNTGNMAANMSQYSNPYINDFKNIAGSLADYALTPAQVQNSYDPVSMQQAGIQAAASNYQKALAAQEALGATTPQARNTALSQYGNISSLQEILRQLGYM